MADEIRAEMVASGLAMAVTAGDSIKGGDSVVMLESTKMEIPVLSEVEGTVGTVAVCPGDVVQEGDLIAVVDN